MRRSCSTASISRSRPGNASRSWARPDAARRTLLHVVLGILPASAGDVLIGGVPLSQLNGELRRSIGCVTQNDCLFAGSIADNISFCDASADQARVEECARLAAIHDEIAALPMAYNTLVGFLGSTLSAGQQQRVLLARALYARPCVLILDEATSHLDLKHERAVAARLKGLEITRILVAHRPETVAAADRIVRLERGRIVPVRGGPRARTQPAAPAGERLPPLQHGRRDAGARSKTCSRTSDAEQRPQQGPGREAGADRDTRARSHRRDVRPRAQRAVAHHAACRGARLVDVGRRSSRGSRPLSTSCSGATRRSRSWRRATSVSSARLIARKLELARESPQKPQKLELPAKPLRA